MLIIYVIVTITEWVIHSSTAKQVFLSMIYIADARWLVVFISEIWLSNEIPSFSFVFGCINSSILWSAWSLKGIWKHLQPSLPTLLHYRRGRVKTEARNKMARNQMFWNQNAFKSTKGSENPTLKLKRPPPSPSSVRSRRIFSSEGAKPPPSSDSYRLLLRSQARWSGLTTKYSTRPSFEDWQAGQMNSPIISLVFLSLDPFGQ